MEVLNQTFEKNDVLCFYNNVLYAPDNKPAVCVVATYDQQKGILEHIFREDGDIEELSKEFDFTYYGDTSIGELGVNPAWADKPELKAYLVDNAEHIQEPKWDEQGRKFQRALVDGLDDPNKFFEAFPLPAANTSETVAPEPEPAPVASTARNSIFSRMGNSLRAALRL